MGFIFLRYFKLSKKVIRMFYLWYRNLPSVKDNDNIFYVIHFKKYGIYSRHYLLYIPDCNLDNS